MAKRAEIDKTIAGIEEEIARLQWILGKLQEIRGIVPKKPRAVKPRDLPRTGAKLGPLQDAG